jgi:hypothetical protein
LISGEGVSGSRKAGLVTVSSPTASVKNVDPVMSGKHIGVSQLKEADWQHSYEQMATA